MDQQRPGGLKDRGKIEAFPVDGQVRKAQVELLVLHHAFGGKVGIFADQQVDLGMVDAECVGDLHGELAEHPIGVNHAHLFVDGLHNQPELLVHGFVFAHDPPGVFVKHLALQRGGHPAAGTVQQRKAQLAFHGGDDPAEPLLADVGFLGHPMYAPRLANLQKIFHVPDIHADDHSFPGTRPGPGEAGTTDG